MSHINYVSGLTRIIGHVKVVGSDSPYDYEPAMYIIREDAARFMGMSYIIALSAMHKYVNPFLQHNHPKMIASDEQQWKETEEAIINNHYSILSLRRVGIAMKEEIDRDIKNRAAMGFALALHKHSRILLITAYNIATLMQAFEITPCPQAAAQMLLFIEDGLDDLKNAPLPIPEKMMNAGGFEIKVDGKVIDSGDLKVTSTQAAIERSEIYGTPNTETIKTDGVVGIHG